jgi:hypothetical protein
MVRNVMGLALAGPAPQLIFRHLPRHHITETEFHLSRSSVDE